MLSISLRQSIFPSVYKGCSHSRSSPNTFPARTARHFQSQGVRYRSVVRRGIEVSGPGSAPTSDAAQKQALAELMAQMKLKITEALETDRVEIMDMYGDGRHVSIDVVSNLFEGKGAVARQRMVYKAIWMELQTAVHAVDAMSTKTPAEASAGP